MKNLVGFHRYAQADAERETELGAALDGLERDGDGIARAVYLQKVAHHVGRGARNDALATQKTFSDAVAAAAARAGGVKLALQPVELTLHPTDNVEILG